MAGNTHTLIRIESHTARRGASAWQCDAAAQRHLDIHFGDVGGGRRFQPFRAPHRRGRCGHTALGQPVRLCQSGAAVSAAALARSRHAWLCRCRDRSCVAGVAGQSRARVLVVYPLLVQGTLPRNRLLEEFRAAGNAVLLGTSSFWEGVDVRGEALSLVVIDKLPFAAPEDPLVRARADALRARGESPFMDDQLPQAVIALKQGVGRLIRDVNDRGVLMLCDPRLLSKSYGRRFLDSLPPMRRTRVGTDVEKFFADEKSAILQRAAAEDVAL